MGDAVYLVDASTFIHRSYHAIRGLSTSTGRPTNAVYGFLTTLRKLLREKEPRLLAVAYDAKGPSFRKGMYDEYKANRPPMPEDLVAQQKPIRGLVAALGLCGIEIEGLEADDIVATLAYKAAGEGRDVVIVSNDKDYYQLLSDRVSMYDPNPKRETSVTVESLAEKFDLTPIQFLDAQGLMGDSTDNIPGVPGVGEKTATRLIARFGSLEEVYEHLDEITQPKLNQNLRENRDQAFLSRELARLKTDADLPVQGPDDLAVGEADEEELIRLYEQLEFTSLLTELNPEQTITYDDYHLVTTKEQLAALAKEIKKADRLAVDLETTSIDPMRAEIVGVSFCAQPRRAFYVPVGHKALSQPQLDWETVNQAVGPIIESPDIPKVGQNIKYDYIVFKNAGLTLGPIADDPMVASYLLDPGTGGHNLDRLAKVHLGHTTITYAEVTGGKNNPFEDITPEAARDYACEDSDAALALASVLRDKLDDDLLHLYENLELPLIEVLAEMEMNGVYVDRGQLEQLSHDLAGRMAESEARIHELAGREFNVNSPKQLGEVLFEDLGLPQGKKTKKKSGWSTDVEVLTDLAPLHDLPKEVLEYRSLAKLRSTYAEALVQLINPRTGRVHTSFNQAVTATGRLSSSDPNLQNIPVRTEEGRKIREAFIAPEGWKILSADYSQIELRVLAHYSGDETLIDAFLRGEDVHTRTAAEVFGLMPGMVTKEMRREAKAINFGIVYGQQAFGLSRQLGIERKQAQKYIDQYFKRYAGVKTFIDENLEKAKKAGYVTTLLGRRRSLADLRSKNYQARSMAERMAVNTPIQGTAADLIKQAMLDVHQRLAESGLKTKMILQVHDELVFEVPEQEIDEATALVREAMEGVMNLAVPLLVDVSHGNNWAEAH